MTISSDALLGNLMPQINYTGFEELTLSGLQLQSGPLTDTKVLYEVSSKCSSRVAAKWWHLLDRWYTIRLAGYLNKSPWGTETLPEDSSAQMAFIHTWEPCWPPWAPPANTHILGPRWWTKLHLAGSPVHLEFFEYYRHPWPSGNLVSSSQYKNAVIHSFSSPELCPLAQGLFDGQISPLLIISWRCFCTSSFNPVGTLW